MQAVRGVSYHIDAGQTLGIVGESGSEERLHPDDRGADPGARVTGQAVFEGQDLLTASPDSIPDDRCRAPDDTDQNGQYQGRMSFPEHTSALFRRTRQETKWHDDPRSEPHNLEHNPTTALVVPRPIGWISTVSKSGVVNLAPYSFFNTVSGSPPYVLFSSSLRKHTQITRRRRASSSSTSRRAICARRWAPHRWNG